MKKYIIGFVVSAFMLTLSANLAFAGTWSWHSDRCAEGIAKICPLF